MTKIVNARQNTRTPRRQSASIAFGVCVLILTACTLPDTLPVESHPTTTSVVVDFRRTQHPGASAIQRTVPRPDQLTIIDSVLGQGAGDTLRISASARGAFTRAHARQTLYLIVAKASPVIDPNPNPPVIAIYENNQLLTQFIPPRKAFSDIATVADIDSDGVTEVFFQTDAYQMGHFFSTIDLYRFDNGRVALRHFDTLYDNGCDTDDPDAVVRASTLGIHTEHNLIRRDYAAPCPPDDTPPDPDTFKPL